MEQKKKKITDLLMHECTCGKMMFCCKRKKKKLITVTCKAETDLFCCVVLFSIYFICYLLTDILLKKIYLTAILSFD